MQKKYRIAIVGIGGVGGFIGGKLAAAYANTDKVEVLFIARGANAEAIKSNGLKLVANDDEIIVHPDFVADDIQQIGELDLVICCTKAYSLEQSIMALASGITNNTLILPLLNGVDSADKLRTMFPNAKVLNGCIYVVSKLLAPGVVQQRGEFYALHFGGPESMAEEMTALMSLLKRADINTIFENDIVVKLWSKFSFISPIATYTSVHNISIGQILESDVHTSAIRTLMGELVALSTARGIKLPADVVAQNFSVMSKLPYEATSSMQADYANNKQTELETLTGIIVDMSKEQALQLPSYERAFQLLRER